MTIAPELRVVLGSTQFRRLFAVRATGQFCDGLFQAALATFVLFSPERQPSAASIAAAFAILYLPYSIVGPFAGVFLDRWSRREVLLYGNLLRTVVVVLVAIMTVAGRDGLDLGLAVLVALGINRFILAGLSASLPHTVPAKDLVTANAFSPTAGTLFAAVGGLIGVILQSAIGGGDTGSLVIILLSAVGFATSGCLALRISRGSLGPDGSKPGDSFGDVVRGLVDGAQALRHATPAWRAVSVVTMHRITFGVVTVIVILLLRNTLNPMTEPEVALGQLSFVVGGAAGGALIGAILTPILTRRIGPVWWSSITLVVAGVITPIGVGMATLPAMIVGGVALGLAGQSTKICADTAVQTHIHDDHRGRVFSLYDVLVNIGLVLGVVFAALTSPASGKSPLDLVVVAGLLIGTALVYLAGDRSERRT